MRTRTDVGNRLGGAAVVLGGVAWAVKVFHDRNDAPPWPTDVTDTLFLAVLPLFLVGLADLYGSCRTRLGKWRSISLAAYALGLIGFLGSALGLGAAELGVSPSWWPGVAWWAFIFGFFLANLGLVFLGNSMIQSRTLPRRAPLPLLIGSLGVLLILVGDPPTSPLGIYPSLALWTLYGLAWAALGGVLWSSQGRTGPNAAGVARTSPETGPAPPPPFPAGHGPAR